MNLHEALLYVVHMAKASRGVDAAAIIRSDGTPEGIAFSKQNGKPHSFKSAAVNLVKGMSEARAIGRTDYYLYTTYPPTKMCLGLAMRCHVTEAFFLNPGGQVMRAEAKKVTEDAAPLLGAAPNAGDWAASAEAAEWEIDHLLSKAARGDYSHPFGADYLIYIDQRLEALLTYRERDSKFAHFPPPVVHTSGGGMTDGAQRIFMRAAASMVGLQIGLNIAGNNIGALLVDQSGKILAYGINDNTGDATRHAETNCLAQWEAISSGAGIPAGSHLFTTLRSCDMCSAAITTMAAGPITVHYGESDPGVGQTTLSQGHKGCHEQRSPLPLRPQAVTRWSLLFSPWRELKHLGETMYTTRVGTPMYDHLALKEYKTAYRKNILEHGVNGVTGRLTHPAAQDYFHEQLWESNEIRGPVDERVIEHCASFLLWFTRAMIGHHQSNV